MSAININIERIVFSQVNITPERAECVRTLMAAELERLINRDGLPGGILDSTSLSLNVPAMHPAELRDDFHVAGNLARHIIRALDTHKEVRT